MNIGIISYGGYIPRLRLDRASIYNGLGWYMPYLMAMAQGERAFGNWDEDSVTMAVAAARDCLSHQEREQIDALYLGSSTLPFANRQHASIVSMALNIGEQLTTADFTASQRAGTAAMLAAFDAVGSGHKDRVLVVASDQRLTKAASLYEMAYGDAAASLLVGRGDKVLATFKASHSISCDFVDQYRASGQDYSYTWEERWVREAGYAQLIPQAISGLLQKTGMAIGDLDHIIYPCFLPQEHKNIAKILGVPYDKVQDPLYDVCGETGVAHPLLMLVAVLDRAKPGEKILMASFGQGCDALCLEVTEGIAEVQRRDVFSSCLNSKLTTDNYFKFLQFRGLIETETGIRAEAPTQTALSALWRNRHTVLGLVGGVCKQCQTPQYPKPEICVNPECRAMGDFEDYAFADRKAHIKSYTGDMLAVSQDPPAVYGMVEFEGGGRFIADLTDCDITELAVGQSVQMVFRKKYSDPERGFIGYFWKATPTPDAHKTTSKKREKSVRFDGQVAVITGAGGGLGRVYALELAKRGAKIVVNDLGSAPDGSGEGSTSPADAVVAEIQALGGEAVANCDSVTSERGGQAIIETAIRHFGRIDILINNAGILRDKSFNKMDADLWQIVRSVHLDGAFYVTQPAFQKMREQGYGRIIMTTSAAGLYGNFGQANYSTAKMGLIGLMNALKLEGEKCNIKVNTIAPIAASRLTRDVFPEDLLAMSAPELVAPLLLWLCSRDCPSSGGIFNAGMGYYNRVAVVTAHAVTLKSSQTITPEDIGEYWSRIDSLTAAQECDSAMDFISKFVAKPAPYPIDKI